MLSLHYALSTMECIQKKLCFVPPNPPQRKKQTKTVVDSSALTSYASDAEIECRINLTTTGRSSSCTAPKVVMTAPRTLENINMDMLLFVQLQRACESHSSVLKNRTVTMDCNFRFKNIEKLKCNLNYKNTCSSVNCPTSKPLKKCGR